MAGITGVSAKNIFVGNGASEIIKTFLKEYDESRLRAVQERDDFFGKLSKVEGLKVHPSKGNFFLAELTDGSRANDLMVRLLVKHGIYIRP